jgi:hypothetical protein
MPYTPLPLPTHVPDPLRAFVAATVENYLWEVHYLLAIPAIPGQGGAYEKRQFQWCIANTLLAVIAGVAATLTTNDEPPGRQFKDALRRFYPWDRDEPRGINAEGAANVLYEVFRNPLVHTAMARPKGRPVKIGRVFPGLSPEALEERVVEIETTRERPPSKPSMVVRDDAIVLWIDPLYWGIREMIPRALADAEECTRVLERIASGRAFERR